MNSKDQTKLQKTKETFSRWSESYDNDGWSWYFKKCDQAIIKTINKLSGDSKSVLDVGCGTGRLLVELANMHSTYKFTGIDATNEMYNRAVENTKNYSNIILENTDFGNFSPTKKFDIIIFSNSFHHIENQLNASTRCAELLNKDGVLIIVDPFRDNVVRLFWEFFSKHLIFHEPYIRYLTKSQLRKLFSAPNFSFINEETISYFVLLSAFKRI